MQTFLARLASKTVTLIILKLVFKTNYLLMLVKSIAECSKWHSAILLTLIKLPFVIKIFVLSIFEWPFYTGFIVLLSGRNERKHEKYSSILNLLQYYDKYFTVN